MKRKEKKEDISHKRRAGSKGQHCNLGQTSRQKKRQQKNKREEKERVSQAFDRQRRGYNIVMGPTIPRGKKEKKRKEKKRKEKKRRDKGSFGGMGKERERKERILLQICQLDNSQINVPHSSKLGPPSSNLSIPSVDIGATVVLAAPLGLVL